MTGSNCICLILQKVGGRSETIEQSDGRIFVEGLTWRFYRSFVFFVFTFYRNYRQTSAFLQRIVLKVSCCGTLSGSGFDNPCKESVLEYRSDGTWQNLIWKTLISYCCNRVGPFHSSAYYSYTIHFVLSFPILLFTS